MIFFANHIFAQQESRDTQSEDTYQEEEEDTQEFYFEKSILMGFNFQLGIPQGQFGDNVDVTGW
ncbi:MAG: hypothetical protein AAF573_08585, partial [Bacteroidota bacterium]